MSGKQNTRKTVAIIGGGVSGSLTAYHLVQRHVDVEVVMIEPRPELGLGLAYSTPSLRHLLNVPAGKISALSTEPNHFLDWLRQTNDPDATAATFAPRAVFGKYIQSLMATTRGIRHIHSSVVDVEGSHDGALLTMLNGDNLWADYVVLAMGNFDPAALPGIQQAAIDSGEYCHNAWLANTYEGLSPDAPVTLIGTGLTAVDVLLRLRELGHRGVITAVSRHGIFPNRHADYTPAEVQAIPAGTPATCIAYLRALRSAIALGTEWRAAFDSLRACTNDLWLALPIREQMRFRRHLQRRWDVVRHRMAPMIADQIEAELAAGTLSVRDGHLQSVVAQSDGVEIQLRTLNGHVTMHTTRVINCTGPSMNYRKVDSPLLESLFVKRLAMPGKLGGGLHTSRAGALISASGEESAILFNLGPGRLGTLLESIAIPEIREQAVELATILAAKVGAPSSSRSLRRSPVRSTLGDASAPGFSPGRVACSGVLQVAQRWSLSLLLLSNLIAGVIARRISLASLYGMLVRLCCSPPQPSRIADGSERGMKAIRWPGWWLELNSFLVQESS